MSRPTVDQASKQNIGDSEFGNLVVRWCEQDKNSQNEYYFQSKHNLRFNFEQK